MYEFSFLIILIVLLFGLFFLYSFITGFRHPEYRSQGPFKGKRFYFVFGSVPPKHRIRKSLGIRLCTVGVNDEGIYFARPFWLRLGNQRLFIPWNEISTTEIAGFIFDSTEFSTYAGQFVFRLSKGTAQKIANAVTGEFSFSSLPVDPELPGVGEGIKLTPEFRTFFQSYENRGILRSEDGCPLVFSVMHSERLFELVHSYSPPTKSIVLRDDAELRAAFQARFPVREIKDIDPAEKDFDF